MMDEGGNWERGEVSEKGVKDFQLTQGWFSRTLEEVAGGIAGRTPKRNPDCNKPLIMSLTYFHTSQKYSIV
jgi:hypothetical protein